LPAQRSRLCMDVVADILVPEGHPEEIAVVLASLLLQAPGKSGPDPLLRGLRRAAVASVVAFVAAVVLARRALRGAGALLVRRGSVRAR